METGPVSLCGILYVILGYANKLVLAEQPSPSLRSIETLNGIPALRLRHILILCSQKHDYTTSSDRCGSCMPIIIH